MESQSGFTSQFFFTTCQVGAEPALKAEIARNHPDLRFAYSRPGFVTFKSPIPLHSDATLQSVFARTYGLSVGKAGSVDEVAALLKSLSPVSSKGKKQRLHVFERDRHAPGEEPMGYQAGEKSAALRNQLLRSTPIFDSDGAAQVGDSVIDVILLEDDQWWVGTHVHSASHSAFPGARPPLELPAHAPSRAFLKLEEALLWSEAPIRAGDVAVEIGSAPGGASFALLERGVQVVGIDPAEMDPRVRNHKLFKHIQKPVADVLREDLPTVVDWLLVDMNVEPRISMFAVDRLGSRMKDSLQGMLLTIKLNQWKMAGQVPEWIEHVKAIGNGRARAKQLFYNRQEVFIYGLTRKGISRV